MYSLGLDIGGTKIESVIMKDNGDVIAKQRVATERDQGYDKVLEKITKLCLDTIAQTNINIKDLIGIGAGLPGAIEPQTGIMLNGNTEIFIGKNFQKDLSEKLNFKQQIITANDANCFVLAEAMFGAGKKYEQATNIKTKDQTAIGIIIGTGCGGGLIINNNIFLGKNGGATEIGHTNLVENGHQCYCSRRGCAESYLSGKGIELNFELETGEKVSSVEIFQRANQNEKISVEFVDKYRTLLLKFLLNLANIYNPHYFVLGGGVSLQKSIYENIEPRLWEQTFIKNSRPKVYQHVIGDSAGVIGAASLPISKL
jgi:fructokinase